MAYSMRINLLVRRSFSMSSSFIVQACQVTIKTTLKPIHGRESKNLVNERLPNIWHEKYLVSSLRNLSTCTNTDNVCFEGGKRMILLEKIEVALKDHQVEEAWKAYNYFKKVYGFPNHSIMRELITKMSYSSSRQWLQRACDLVFSMLEEKSDLLQPEFLTKLSLSLSRAQMPSPASRIFRLMIEKEMPPPRNILELFFLHITRTENGTYLASNILIELCDHLELINAKRSTAKQTKLETVIFNVVLNSCIRFGAFFKGQQIVELMSQYGIIADAHSIVIISQIHEANGQRDELKKFKHHVDRVPPTFLHHYRQFYDNLLSLNFKFNDVDAASQLILDLYRGLGSLQSPMDRNNSGKPCLVPIGFHNLRKGLKLQILPELLQKDSIIEVEDEYKDNFLVLSLNGKIVLTNKGIAWVILLYKRCGRILELPKLLVRIQELGPLKQENMPSMVVGACINLGWLDIAHDILDDMESAGCRLDICSYALLLRAYYANNMTWEAEAMLKQLKSRNLSELEVKTLLSAKRLTSDGDFSSVESFIRGVEENENDTSFMVHKLNSSIYFFWKAEMIDDALKTFNKFQEMKIFPTVQTFFIIVSGYSSLKMYREITILWGDIKRQMENGNLVVNRDLYELLILNFLRGGYFERVLEVIGLLKKSEMYIDKYILKTEFLKFHKNLYRNLRASNSRTEAQNKRIEHVRAFRKWVGVR